MDPLSMLAEVESADPIAVKEEFEEEEYQARVCQPNPPTPPPLDPDNSTAPGQPEIVDEYGANERASAHKPAEGPGRVFSPLSGELVVMNLKNTALQSPAAGAGMLPGELVMTTYQLVFHPRLRGWGAEQSFMHLPASFFRIPLSCIDRIERERDRARTGMVQGMVSAAFEAEPLPGVTISIYTKDLRCWRLVLERVEDTERAYNAVVSYVFPAQVDLLFAFNHRINNTSSRDAGWSIYDPKAEFDRLGIGRPRPDGSQGPWRYSYVNRDYSVCPSYPPVLVVPATMPDRDIPLVAAFRSEQRLPACAWARTRDSASIWRSSQPKVGVQQATCVQDEHMLDALARSGDGMLRIIDCRPRTNAMANMAAGYGYENTTTTYTSSRLTFMDIGNIHVMRQSYQKLEALALGTTVRDTDWMSLVEDTKWLSHVRLVLHASWTVASAVHHRCTPVLVHCSHGWDRTSQVSALAQVLLDPYYRTIDGFQVLVEKEWLMFGHPFQLRHAHGITRAQGKEDQRSPIFLQFLDSVWQLVSQFPSAFEFNSRYLICIADHLYSCRFGTFIANCDRVRKEVQLTERTASLWTYLEINRSAFESPYYVSTEITDGVNVKEAVATGHGVLLPQLSCILRRVTLWSDYYLRWSPRPSFPGTPRWLGEQLKTYPDATRAGLETVDTELERAEGMGDEAESWVKLARLQASAWRARAKAAEKQCAELKRELASANRGVESFIERT
ncbi:unnamed protein product [Chrysoparadoxa australica]